MSYRDSLPVPSETFLFQHETSPLDKVNVSCQKPSVAPAVSLPSLGSGSPAAHTVPSLKAASTSRPLTGEVFSVPLRRSSRTKTNSSVFQDAKYPGYAFFNSTAPDGPVLQTAMHEVPDHVAMPGPDREEWVLKRRQK